MNKNLIIKLFAAILVLALVLPAMLSCEARPLAKGKLASSVVGTVGNYDVLYEELYLLANSYKIAVAQRYGDDTEGLRKAVTEYVNENITSNYAILTLCAENGIEYDEKALKDDVEKNIELFIGGNFDGSRSDYLAALKEQGSTNHYHRFTEGVDILYARLQQKYMENGIIPNTDELALDYMVKNFRHTWHIAIFVNSGDDRAAKLAKAEEALSLLNSGKATMFELIGGSYKWADGDIRTYNESTDTDPFSDVYGYYFPRGVMDEAYENAAFALAPNQLSEVVVGMGKNSNGQSVECFYIIQGLEVKKAEIEAHFETLYDDMAASIILPKVEEIEEALEFSLNDYGKSLDILNLKEPKDGVDYIMILWVGTGVLAVAAVVTTFVLVYNFRKKKFRERYARLKK